MSWKTIVISSENKFSINNGFLVLKKLQQQDNNSCNKDNIVKIALNEIDLILIENYKSILTVASLLELSSRNISLILTDIKHDPTTLLLPITSHHKPLQNFRLQLELNSRTKNILHRDLIIKKIENQRSVLIDVGSEEKVIDKFYDLMKGVIQGDKTNREAVAARIFFREMYGSAFIRFADDGINSFINFGYKIIASKISNSLVKYGLNPSMGLFHSNQTNYFNLSYDFIEPFRPLVDWLANELSDEIDSDLTISLKLKLLRLLDFKVLIDGRYFKVRNAIDVMVKSFVSFLNNDVDRLNLPVIYLDLIRKQLENEEFSEF